MDVEQRRQIYSDIQRKADAVVGVAKGVIAKKELPTMEFVQWMFREILPEHMDKDSVMNNCAKYFILSDVGYTNSAFDGVLDVGLNRISAIDRGRDVVRASRKWMQVWADIEELTK
jgi:hypothetical protein